MILDKKLSNLRWKLKDAYERHEFDCMHFDLIYKGRVEYPSVSLEHHYIATLKKEFDDLENYYKGILVGKIDILPELRIIIKSYLFND